MTAMTAFSQQDLSLIDAHLHRLRTERRLADSTVTMYTAALLRLREACEREGVGLCEVKAHQVRGWVARLHAQGLGPRSLAITLSAWRGLYQWLGVQRLVPSNPADGLRPPKAPRPLPKALAVDQAVALAAHLPADAPADAPTGSRAERETPWLAARDHAMVELLYSSGLRSAELLTLDVRASAQAAGWLDMAGAEAHVLGKGSKRRTVPVGQPGRPEQPRAPAHAAPQLCQPPAAVQRRFARRARAAGPRPHPHHAGLHAAGLPAPGPGLRRGPPPGQAQALNPQACARLVAPAAAPAEAPTPAPASAPSWR
jgi:integrase/recombinase XerC